MYQLYIIYLVTFILAFSSIVYELLLGQTLSAFLGNTVLRYSVTVGLYMFSMGIGALAAAKKTSSPVLALLSVELVLVCFGGGSIILLHFIYSSGLSLIFFSVAAHALIVIIGILTGFEIPLLMKIAENVKKEIENNILGLSYLGAFAGSVLFAFVFYPYAGLVETAFLTAILNVLGGVSLYGIKTQNKKSSFVLYSLLFILGILLIVGLVHEKWISEYLIQVYLNA